MRERRLAVGVVAASNVTTLQIAPQKLLSVLDGLTLRLMGRLPQQQAVLAANVAHTSMHAEAMADAVNHVGRPGHMWGGAERGTPPHLQHKGPADDAPHGRLPWRSSCSRPAVGSAVDCCLHSRPGALSPVGCNDGSAHDASWQADLPNSMCAIDKCNGLLSSCESMHALIKVGHE
jgi:hypothetical protein